jgi:hypothetical protein
VSSKSIFRICLLLATAAGGPLASNVAQAQAPVTLSFDQPQTACISGFRQMWDTPVLLDESGPTEVVEPYGTAREEAPSAFWMPSAKQRQRADGTLKSGALVFDAQDRSLLVRRWTRFWRLTFKNQHWTHHDQNWTYRPRFHGPDAL